MQTDMYLVVFDIGINPRDTHVVYNIRLITHHEKRWKYLKYENDRWKFTQKVENVFLLTSVKKKISSMHV